MKVEHHNQSWHCSAIYASPVPSCRDQLWSHLIHLRGRIQGPWALVGDFNEISMPSEVVGGSFNLNRATGFNSMMDDCNMMDLGAVGGKFTWFRHTEGGHFVHKRLDRGLGDTVWRRLFPEAYVEVLGRIRSDHAPLLLRCGKRPERKNERPFRYQVAWTTHPHYLDVVTRAWNNAPNDMVSKLKNLVTFLVGRDSWRPALVVFKGS